MCVLYRKSEAWGPPQFQEKRSRSEKAILRAPGAFRGSLGAALGVQKRILGMRNPILGMASHNLCNAKATILGATPRAIPGIDGNPHGRLSFAPTFSGRFSRIGAVPARQRKTKMIFKKLCVKFAIAQNKLFNNCLGIFAVSNLFVSEVLRKDFPENNFCSF